MAKRFIKDGVIRRARNPRQESRLLEKGYKLFEKNKVVSRKAKDKE